MEQQQITRAQAQDHCAKVNGYDSWDDLKSKTFSNRAIYLAFSECAYNYWQSLINQNNITMSDYNKILEESKAQIQALADQAKEKLESILPKESEIPVYPRYWPVPLTISQRIEMSRQIGEIFSVGQSFFMECMDNVQNQDPHSEFKKAYAQGKTIQYFSTRGLDPQWRDMLFPSWNVGYAYRIKPEEVDPYAELKKAHAEGKIIQFYYSWIGWKDVEQFSWDYDVKYYRVKPESSVKVGTWYRREGEEGTYLFVTEICEDNLKGYGFVEGDWIGAEDRETFGGWAKDDRWLIALYSEVDTMLIKEAEKRGFKEGVNVRGMCSDRIYQLGKKLFNANAEKGYLIYGTLRIFRKGKWANIVSQAPKVGDVCKFWDDNESDFVVGMLARIYEGEYPVQVERRPYGIGNIGFWKKAKKITTEEAIELLFGKGVKGE